MNKLNKNVKYIYVPETDDIIKKKYISHPINVLKNNCLKCQVFNIIYLFKLSSGMWGKVDRWNKVKIEEIIIN